MESVLSNVGFLGFLLGSVLGSFGLVLASRSLKNQSFVGRSKCGHCNHTLSALDLLPVFSYLILKGRCRYCRKKIGLEYLLMEVVMGILVGYLFWQSFNSVQFTGFSLQSVIASAGGASYFQFLIFIFDVLFKTFFITVLAVLFVTDYKKMLIPDRIILPAIKISLIYPVAIAIYKVGYLYYYLNQSPIGRLLLPPHSDYFQRHVLISLEPLIGSLIMGLLIGGFFWALIIITKGKGMGGGDVKLGSFIGFALGFPNALPALILSFMSGAVVSIILIIFGKKHFGQYVPFGPFLVLGSLIALFWGPQIINWYLNLSI